MTALTTLTTIPNQYPKLAGLGRKAAFIIAIVLCVAVFLAQDKLESLAVYGYPAVFLVSLLGNATVFLPAPTIAIVAIAGASLDPIAVGLAAAAGATLGELTGFLIGLSGQGVLPDKPVVRRIRRAMDKAGTPVIFGLSAVPNPCFDIGGLIAGASGMPMWRFLAATFSGKTLRFILLAALGPAIM